MSLATLRAAALLLAVAATVGCSVHRVDTAGKLPVRLPGAYAGGHEEPPDTGRWWERFGDAGLDRLVDRALRSNYDLRRAAARLAIVRAAARIAGAGRIPQLSAGLNASFSQRPFYIQERILTITGYSAPISVTASYELDLWGRIAAGRRAALADVAAGREDLAAAAMSVAAGVVDTWLTLRETRAQIGLVGHQVEVGDKLLGVVQGRFARGMSTAVDVLQQRQQVAALRAQLPRLEASAENLLDQLRVLLGEMPGADIGAKAGASLPALPPLPPTGVPAELLDYRPDVRAARLRVVAADHRVGVALADRYPSLRLSGQAGLSAINQEGDFLQNPAWSLAAGLLGPILDGGRRAAEVERRRATLRQVVLAWVQAVQKAMLEVSNALRNERQQKQTIDLLDGRLELARETLAEARRRYAGGVGDYLRVLTSLQALQDLERRRLSAGRQLLAYRVSLHRALGGTWTAKLPAPDGDGEDE